MIYRSLWLDVPLVIISLFVPISHATMILPSSLEYMTGVSDTIITGNVTDKYSYWEDDKIYTSVFIETDKIVKRSDEGVSSSIEIKLPGGKVGDIALEIDEAPHFRIGEKVMLFLKRRGNVYSTYGFNYGVYRIYYDKDRGKELIDGPLFTNAEHYNLATMKKVRSAEPLGPNELDSFIERVEQLVK